MFEHISAIVRFIIDAFLHVWPYLLVTIPLAVGVNMSGASKYIERAFRNRPVVAILLATAVGAFSPLCSQGVIPVIAALLIGGVPLAPVMSFWVASPSMDPEIFFLSVGTIGLELAIWRLVGTLILSLSAGFITHFLEQRGWLGKSILRTREVKTVNSTWTMLKNGWQHLKYDLATSPLLVAFVSKPDVTPLAVGAACRASTDVTLAGNWQPSFDVSSTRTEVGCDTDKGHSSTIEPGPFHMRLLEETRKATLMVVKYMALAFFLEALIELYVPSEWIAGMLGQQNPWAVPMAALLGVPAYTSNLTALPLVSGLLAQGMKPAAGLAFLIAGATTTLPAMAAVWGIVERRVFVLYLSYSLVGGIVLGYTFSLMKVLL